MARDLAEQERAFVDALASGTGRDLAAWMQAIAQSGHIARNDIIDWLRHQGFTFSNASWLERIHHNGGQLIYGGIDTRAVAVERAAFRPRTPTTTDSQLPQQEEPTPASAGGALLTAESALPSPSPDAPPADAIAVTEPQLSGEPGPQPPAANDAEIAALLMAAKGLRPLADYILREMDLVVPALVRQAGSPFVTLLSPMPFAALLPAPRDIRLFADFGPGSRDRSRKAEAGRLPAPFPDVIVLNDARQVDDRFRELVAAAYTRALK